MKLEWREATKSYGEKNAVDNFSLEVDEGELLVLIGPSGCGKTTSLKMINRLVEPDSGSVMVNGENIADIPVVEHRRRVGYVIQQVGLFPHMTVADNVAAVPHLLKWEKDRIERRTRELLDLVGLPPDQYADSWPAHLSGGEAQRVGVARALAADPPILLMDEPFGAVDPLTREVLQREFLRIQSAVGKTVVFVTHDLDEAIRLGDRIAVMNEGRLVSVAVPEELLLDPDPFVRDFTGDDRALRRLARISVGDIQTDVDPRFSASSSRNTVRSDASLKDALAVMLQEGLSGLDVVDASGTVIGRLTMDDLISSAGVSEAS